MLDLMTLLVVEGKDLGTLIHREQRGTKSIQFPILSYNKLVSSIHKSSPSSFTGACARRAFPGAPGKREACRRSRSRCPSTARQYNPSEYHSSVLTNRLQVLLDLSVQSTGLQSDDWGSGLGVVSNGRTAFGTEDTVDSLAGGSVLREALGGAVDGQGVLGDDSDES